MIWRIVFVLFGLALASSIVFSVSAAVSARWSDVIGGLGATLFWSFLTGGAWRRGWGSRAAD